jgi:hypothetical protein
MKHQFSMTEVNKWAHFSGDFNPIHFDLSYARILGEDRLIVHGMLATMPFKQDAWRHYQELGCCIDGWIKFRTLFRKPLAHDEVVVMTHVLGRTPGFRINQETSGQEHFRGSCTPGAPPLKAARPCAEPIASTLPLTQVEAFTTAYPEFPEPWIALDAVLFSEFMRCKLDEIYAIAKQRAPAAYIAETKQIVVHSSHTVNFDAEFFLAFKPNFPWSTVTYGLLDPDLIWSENRVICTVPIWVKAGERQVMSLEVGVVVIF